MTTDATSSTVASSADGSAATVPHGMPGDGPGTRPAAPGGERGGRGGTIAVVGAHLVVIGAFVAWGAVRYVQHEREVELPPLLSAPLEITPLYDDSAVVSDEQLRQTLWKLRPRLAGPNPTMNNVDHALRFWGVEAVFADQECLSGVEMRELLTDHRRFRGVWEEGTNSLLVDTLYGVVTRVQQGLSTASHVDHTVASLAEVGTPRDFPLITKDGETTFQAMIEHARRDFRLNQIEYEWSALVFALYMPTDQPWRTQEGQWIDFDRLAERIMRQSWTRGVCFGNHRLFTLAAMLRVDDVQPILSPEMRADIVDHLRRATELLIEHQRPEGSWNAGWDGVQLEVREGMTPLQRRVLATGHALEWWAIAPEEVQPPREVVVRAGQWLVRTIAEMSEAEVRSGYTFLTHAGRALALWRSRRPADVIADVRPDES